MVAFFEFLQFPEPGHEWMTVDAIEKQAAVNLLVALFSVQAMVGGQDENGVAAEPKQLRYRLAPQIVCAGVMRRIEIGQNQNFHRPDRDPKTATRSWRAIPGNRKLEALFTFSIHQLERWASLAARSVTKSFQNLCTSETKLDFAAPSNRECLTPFEEGIQGERIKVICVASIGSSAVRRCAPSHWSLFFFAVSPPRATGARLHRSAQRSILLRLQRQVD
jgi:hypothetical protein